MASGSQQRSITKLKIKLSGWSPRKLLPGEKVEVRSTEDGFLGSWHTGTVLKRGRFMCHVKYDHLLCENGLTNLVELVKVSSMIDGVVPAKWDPDNYRGVIRPSPTTLDIVNRSLHYGECVDLFYQDAWWEGVIFDRDDGFKNRRVFFPDMGDEMTVCVKNLRITQDWNEVTEEWKPRGNWIFLEIVDEMMKKLPLVVSVKQIWYEVREKNAFKDWTISVRDYWRRSISVVLFDNLKLTITQFLCLLKSAQGFLQDGQSLEFSQLPLNDILESVEFIDNVLSLDRTRVLSNNFRISSIQKNLNEEIVPMDITPTIDEVGNSDKNLESLVTQSIGGVLSPDEMLFDGHEELHCKSSKLTAGDVKFSQSKSRLKWYPIELEAQPCPEALEESLRAGTRVPNDMLVKLRKHLLHLGWNIDYAVDYQRNRPINRFRYLSPSGSIFMSLVKVCEYLHPQAGHMDENISSESAPEDMEHVQPGHSAVSKKRKFMGLNRAGDVVASSQTSTRVLRSYKRARQEGPTSHQTPRSVLSWLIDNNVVLPRTKVHYRERDDSHPKKEGRISHYGVKCNCCQEIYGLSNFGAHAGNTDHSPSKNIFLEDGRSILDCQLEMKRKIYAKKKEPRLKKVSHNIRANDYICSICNDGGDLILCDKCPSSFHPHCLGMMEIPEGDWFCPFCCCGICGHSNDLFAANNAVSCSQCENQYHVGCITNNGLPKPGTYPEGHWFCNKKCEQIFFGLHKLLGKPICLRTDKLSWTLLKYPKPGNFSHNVPDNEPAIESYSKLSVALGVLHECFEPIIESRTGSDLMEDMVFNRWSELGRLNFQGFYTVLLERNDEIITVATVRVHGEKVAEVPFVATRFQYRRLGMCKILMNVLEKKLTELGVERLVLPAATSVLDTWTRSFGFSVVKDSDRSNFLNFNILNFYGTVMCQKLLTRTSMELIVFTESTQHKADKDYCELDGASGVSEVVQDEQNDGTGIMDQGTSTSSNNPAPLLALKQTSAPEFPAQITLDDVYGRKEVENGAGVGLLKCYKRRRRLLFGEAELFLKEITP